MDSQRFDSVTKLIAQGKSRRSILKAIAASSVAGIFGVNRGAKVLAQCLDEGKICVLDGDCCVGHCYAAICCTGANNGEACTTADDCCGGFCNNGLCDLCGEGSFCDGECCNGFTCEQGSGTCQPSECSELEGDCSTSVDCCSDLVCNGFGACADTCSGERGQCETGADCCAGSFCQQTGDGLACIPSDSCLREGDACQSDQVGPDALVSICCDGLACIDDLCVVTCAAEGEFCGVSPSGGNAVECCSDFACIDSVCTNACEAEGTDCNEDTDCCEGICCAGFCRTIECCIDDILDGGNPNDRCPDGTACFEGYCDPVGGEEEPEPETDTPVVLPNTGAGDSNDGPGMGVLLTGLGVAGAAALIIGNSLADSRQASDGQSEK